MGRRLAVVVVGIVPFFVMSLRLAPAHAAPVAPSAAARSVRVCPVSRSADRVGCFARVRTGISGRPSVTPSVPSGYGPTQFHTAYQLPTTSPKNNQTIGIVDAFDDPNVFADLKKYDKAFGLRAFPRCSATRTKKCLSVLNQDGVASPLPAGDTGWGLEISLDVQVAHAMCQNCRIMLVEASSDAFSDIEIAVNTAVAKGATVVSNSYGDYGNDCAEPGYDHPHVPMVVSSGDSGYQVSCPAVLSTVVSVGGTHLTLGAGNAYGSESVWGGSGSGCSTAATSVARSWQTSLGAWAGIGCGTHRGMNDVAADADPGSGAAVYDSYGYGGWLIVGGTSLSAPLIAATYALAGHPATWPYAAQSVYAAPASSFNDVTTGSNGSCPGFALRCQAGSGFDLPTGVGTPKGLGGF